LGVEYKTWLDLTTNENKALLAKAAIALVNHGGGFIVIGFSDEDELVSRPRPEDMPEVDQDAVNDAIRRYASPEFHCEVYLVPHPNGITHPVISVPGNFAVPVMSKRDCQGVITQHTCYIRKSGPRSEAPQSSEEWRTLLDRCVRASRDELLEAIRGIMSGNAAAAEVPPDALQRLRDQVEQARARWTELVAPLPPDSPSKFPHGYYEMAFSLVGAQRAPGLAELQDRLSTARQVRLTGWTPFLELHRDGLRPYPHDNFVEAWVGRRVEERAFGADPSHADFWRASPDGLLYTIRGYTEDGLGDRPAGRFIDITLPVWRVAEALLLPGG